MASQNGYHANKWIINLRSSLLLIFGVIAIFTIGLYSCHCNDMLCYGADDMGMIEMLNFSEAEVNATFLVFYKKGSEFKIVEDSTRVAIGGTSDSTKFYGSTMRKISVDYDYKLYFTTLDKLYSPTINNVYHITEFRTFKAECNIDCFPKDYYYKVEGYEINGKYKKSSELQIDQLND